MKPTHALREHHDLFLKLHFDKEEQVDLSLLDNFYTEEKVQCHIVEKMDPFEGKPA